jgi:uncharacterized protein (TIGR00730 family)
MRSVCVYCASNPGARPSYTAAARRLGEALAERGLALVYGGASVGLMGTVADAVMAKGGRAIGVLPDFMIKREVAHHALTELRLVGSMHERKAEMAAHADAFIALPGGFGTLDELFEMLTWAQLGLHQKPVALLDVDGYYTPLVAFLDHATAEGLLRPEYRAMLLVGHDADELLDRMARHTPPAVAKAIELDQT